MSENLLLRALAVILPPFMFWLGRWSGSTDKRLEYNRGYSDAVKGRDYKP